VSFAPVVSSNGKPQVAFAISKRCGGAVQRNLIRRRLRGAVRELGGSLIPGAYLIRTDPGVLELSYQELFHNLEECLERAGERGRTDER
jgi:ribonuclease P protein component